MEKIKNYIKQSRLTIIGIIVGSLGGYLFWHYIGCMSGTCPITSSPLNSAIFGSIIGGLVFSMFKANNNKQ